MAEKFIEGKVVDCPVCPWNGVTSIAGKATSVSQIHLAAQVCGEWEGKDRNMGRALTLPPNMPAGESRVYREM